MMQYHTLFLLPRSLTKQKSPLASTSAEQAAAVSRRVQGDIALTLARSPKVDT